MTRVVITGGAGFLGLHLARRLLADGFDVRTLDVAALDDAGLEGAVEEIRGDVRDEHDVRRAVEGADVVVHAAAALPIQASREAIRSVNVEGAAVVMAESLDAGVKRFVLISSTAVYGVPERHPIREGDPLVGVGWYGESKIDAENLCGQFGRRGLANVIIRPKTFVGPERLGVFEILFDWIREGRRIPILGSGDNRYQLLAVEDLVDAVVSELRGAGRRARAERRSGDVRDGPRRSRRTDRARRLRLDTPFGARASPPSSPCERSSSRTSHPSRSGTTERRTRTRSSRSTPRDGCSAGSRSSRTPRRCARPTTGTSSICRRCAMPARPTACPGTSAPSVCSSASRDSPLWGPLSLTGLSLPPPSGAPALAVHRRSSRDRRARPGEYAPSHARAARLPLRVPDPRAHDVPDQPLARGDAGQGGRPARRVRTDVGRARNSLVG